VIAAGHPTCYGCLMGGEPQDGRRRADTIYHLTSETVWSPATGSPYQPASMADDGFIHASAWQQLPNVTARHFSKQEGLVVLEIDATLLPAAPVWEDLYDLGEEYPHLYSAVPVEAVTGVLEVRWEETGVPRFRRRGASPEISAASLVWHRVENPGRADFALLARMNSQLIEDEGHDNQLDRDGLDTRMRRLVASTYQPYLLLSGGLTAGYALVDTAATPLHVRQFFVQRGLRREGIGRLGFAALRETLDAMNLTVDVLSTNAPAIRFWHSVGFTDRSIAMHTGPDAGALEPAGGGGDAG
jgi:uncharacterized protein (DUF952 family)/predicted acetyltransferase